MGRKRRTALGSAEDAEGRGVHLFCPRRTRGGRGELLFSTGIFGFADFRMRGQLREGGAQGAHVLIRGGRGGARRTATSFLSAEDAENVQLLLTAADWDFWILGWGQLRTGIFGLLTGIFGLLTGIFGLLDQGIWARRGLSGPGNRWAGSGELLWGPRRTRRDAEYISFVHGGHGGGAENCFFRLGFLDLRISG